MKKSLIGLALIAVAASSFAETDDELIAGAVASYTKTSSQAGWAVALLTKCGQEKKAQVFERRFGRVAEAMELMTKQAVYRSTYRRAYTVEMSDPSTYAADFCRKAPSRVETAFRDMEKIIPLSKEFEPKKPHTSAQDARRARDRLPICTPDLPPSVPCAR